MQILPLSFLDLYSDLTRDQVQKLLLVDNDRQVVRIRQGAFVKVICAAADAHHRHLLCNAKDLSPFNLGYVVK